MATNIPLYLLNTLDEKLALMARENFSAKNEIAPPKKGQDFGYPSIGMILCRETKRVNVEYALKESNKPIGVAAYPIVRRLPAELKGRLPDPKQIERLLEAVELPNGKEVVCRGERV